ncbi:MAG: hypothetical protein ACYCTW_12395 [Sulfuricella sp.]
MWRPLAAAGLFGLLTYWLYQTAKGLLPIRLLAETPNVQGRRVLIAALSPFGAKVQQLDGQWQMLEVLKEKKNENQPSDEDASNKIQAKIVNLSGDLDKDILAFTTAQWRWPGQQFLRALRPHVLAEADKLDHLVLIGSPGSRGSYGSLDAAKQLALLYAETATVHLHPEAIGFEDIEAMQQTFDWWINFFREKGIAEKDIILDATGGQKTTSIAAALTTLRWERVEFQYVQTEPAKPGEEIRAIGFNVVVDAAHKGVDP